MKRILLLSFLLLLIPLSRAHAQRDVWISAPARGEAVQGVVRITGFTAIPGFNSASVYFAYANNPTGTWFLIASMDEPVNEDLLASWDTSTITDGEYTLRLQVNLQNGSLVESQVGGVRVRNYTPVETPIAQPASAAQPAVTASASPATAIPTSQPLPANPAALSVPDLQASLKKGAIAAAVAFAVIAIYLLLRRLSSRS